VSSLLELQYPNYELILVDGQSEDNSVAVARKTIAEKNQMGVRVQLLEEPLLPQGWLGKSWACHTGQQSATGELLLFTDADTQHSPTSLREITRIFNEQELDSLSIIGHLKTETFWERVILPFFKSLLFTIFGGRFANSKYSKRMLGIGQYILISRTTYDQIGGHQAIKQYISEDIHLVTKAANEGKYAVFNGNSIYTVRMYRNWKEIKEGLGRNSVQSVGGNVWMVVLASIGLIIWRFGPLVIYPLSLAIGYSEYINLVLLLLAVFTIGLYIIDVKTNNSPWYYLFLVPLGLFSLVYILLWATFNKLGNKPLIWKGRAYSYE
jgi:chlorobactene glucosyltransferase